VGMGFPVGMARESNGNPMGMGIGDKIGNGNGKEWETTCIRMGMALIPMGINSHQ